MMKVVILGASAFVVKLSDILKNGGHSVSVFSNSAQLEKPYNLKNNITQQLFELGISVISCENANELIVWKGTFDDAALVVSYGAPWIFKSIHINDTFNNRVINIHGTHLPKYRGGTLFSWQILTGQRTGICLAHKMSSELDAGPVLAYKEFIYSSYCRRPVDYIKEYEEQNIQFIINLISSWNGIQDFNSNQPEYLSSYFPRLLAPVHGWINWDWDNVELERFILAFDEPYAGARCFLNGELVILRDVYAQQMDGYFHPFQYGIVFRNNGEWLTVATKSGELLIKYVSDRSGQNITSQIKVGDKFYTPYDKLLETKRRVIKTKEGLKTK